MTRQAETRKQLHSFLDDELDAGEKRAFEQMLERDPELQKELASFREADEKLRAALGSATAEGVPIELLDTIFSERGKAKLRTIWAVAAAIVIFLAGALSSAYLFQFQNFNNSVFANTATRALEAHRLYVAEVRHPVEVGADQYDHLVGWLSKRVGHKLVTPEFTAAGYSLIGGRLIPAGESAAAQFMYERANGDRLTVFVTRNPTSRNTSFRLASIGPFRAFYWLDGELGYAIVGELSEAELLHLARLAYEQIGAVSS